MEHAAPAPPAIAVVADGERWALKGVLDICTLADAERLLERWVNRRTSRVLDLGDLHGLDTPGALLLGELSRRGVELTGIRTGHEALLDLVCGLEH